MCPNHSWSRLACQHHSNVSSFSYYSITQDPAQARWALYLNHIPSPTSPGSFLSWSSPTEAQISAPFAPPPVSTVNIFPTFQGPFPVPVYSILSWSPMGQELSRASRREGWARHAAHGSSPLSGCSRIFMNGGHAWNGEEPSSPPYRCRGHLHCQVALLG
jgi:hypothetical protein